MSKVVTQRFEYVNYDDAGLVLGSSGVVTAYPVATDIYSNNATATAGSSYGSMTLSPTNATPVVVNVPPGATITMVGAAANTVNVGVTVNNVALVPGGSTVAAVTFPVSPNQMVTLPGVFNNGTLSIVAVLQTLVPANVPVSVQLLWSV